MAKSRTFFEGLQRDPNLYSWSWNRLGLIDPARMEYCFSSPWTAETSAIPFGRSHSTCRASVGVLPVRRLTSAASANFSSIVEAAAGCVNFPNRVPVLAKPHEGISILNSSRIPFAPLDQILVWLCARSHACHTSILSRTPTALQSFLAAARPSFLRRSRERNCPMQPTQRFCKDIDCLLHLVNRNAGFPKIRCC